MERLDFELPEFTRLSWVSDAARNSWEPRLRRIVEAWAHVQGLSVAAGVRRCALIAVPLHSFADEVNKWGQHGLGAVPFGMNAPPVRSYFPLSSETQDEGFDLLVLVGKDADIAEFVGLSNANDLTGRQALLGAPPCCARFAQEIRGMGHRDTSWFGSASVIPSLNGEREIEVAGPPETNIFWQRVEICAVPHAPCRVDCEASVKLGDELLTLGREAGFKEEMEWLREVLSWPVEWSALHGIAEIKTPLLKISTQTDATPVKYVIKRQGTMYPSEMARGLNFPYHVKPSPRLTGSQGFLSGIDNPIQALPQSERWYALDNGFDTREIMDAGHQPIVQLARRTLAGKGGRVLDLGCGNGALLKKICESGAAGVIPFGIEVDPVKIEHARLLLPHFASHFKIGDMFGDQPWADDSHYRLVILMPGKLLEVNAEQAEKLRARLRHRCDQVLLYAYGDWLTRYGDLSGLCRMAGFEIPPTDPHSWVALASG
jgi:hypothetical protein